MSYMLLIAEPVGQRAERSQAEGKLLYESMVEFGAGLKERGLLIASESLASGGVRIKKRDGQASLIDGPFAEAREMVAGFSIWEVKDMDEAVAWAKRCPMLPGTMEIRPFYEVADLADFVTPEELAAGGREGERGKLGVA